MILTPKPFQIRSSFFCKKYQNEVKRFAKEKPPGNSLGAWVDKSIKWTTELERHLAKGDRLAFAEKNITSCLYRPFVTKHSYYAPIITHRRYQMPQIFPHEGSVRNAIICFCVNAKDFYVIASDRLGDLHLTGDTQCLPLYRYKEDGKRVSNITEWGLRQFREHYADECISVEDIFSYTYAVLHDPEYREKYAADLLREFPRLPFYPDFRAWVGIGQMLLDLHIGFESVQPYSLSRDDTNSAPGKPSLKADMDTGVIVLDKRTRLTGVPKIAWEYRLGSRSAIEWVLDQYKERKPKDPTIAAKFNTYRFADYKERVIDLLGRVCMVSVRTMELIDSMPSRSCPTPVKSG